MREANVAVRRGLQRQLKVRRHERRARAAGFAWGLPYEVILDSKSWQVFSNSIIATSN